MFLFCNIVFCRSDMYGFLWLGKYMYRTYLIQNILNLHAIKDGHQYLLLSTAVRLYIVAIVTIDSLFGEF